MTGLSHLDATGKASMVDVGAKAETAREAVAQGRITMAPGTLALIQEGGIEKGDVFSVARLAGIMAAKKTADLIPLCHPLPLSSVGVTLTIDKPANAIIIEATARVFGRTGVEMEALTAVAIAALTIYDMAKAVDRSMVIGEIRLIKKTGGRSGLWEATS